MNLPNSLTILRILLAPVFFVLQLSTQLWSSYAAAAVFLVAAFTDLLDGYLARKYSTSTSFGKFMDPLADKILVSTAFIAFLSQDYIDAWMVGLIIFREFFITGLRLLAVNEGQMILPTRTAKMKTVFQMTAIAVVLVHQSVISTLAYCQMYDIYGLEHALRVFIEVLMVIATFLTVWTGVVYVVKNFAVLKGAFTSRPQTPTVS